MRDVRAALQQTIGLDEQIVGVDRPERAFARTVPCADGFESKSNNSAYIGMCLTGRATDVYTDGTASLEDGKVTF